MKWKIRVNDILTPNDKKLKLLCGKHLIRDTNNDIENICM